MSTIPSITGTDLSIASLTDLNAYALGFCVTSGGGFAGTSPCAYTVSNGGITGFDATRWLDSASGPSASTPQIAYMPVGGGKVGRLFSAWAEGTDLWIAELQLAKDATSGNISITGVVGNNRKSLVGITVASSPAIAVVGHYVVAAYQLTNDHLDMAVSNDLVSSPTEFTFTPVGGIIGTTGAPEMASAPPALAANGGALYMAWKGFDSAADKAINDISVGQYTLGSSTPVYKTSMAGLSATGPAITYASGEPYLAYCQAGDQHLCTWPASDWNKVSSTYLADTTANPPSVCGSIDGTQLVLAWRGQDTQQTANVSFEHL
ncbi:hypothetical protein [Granulicella sp. L60]|uniref:hypothetical protein n=1 Tax=Granulicella sp. L60 TaxID=1641866 RepID=UPI00131B1243|nr:hypothetical protein [Granulicella sp. L60]